MVQMQRVNNDYRSAGDRIVVRYLIGSTLRLGSVGFQIPSA